MQPSFFDLDNRHRKLNERDPLTALNKLIDWESFRDTLERGREKPRKSAAGRKPFDAVLMFTKSRRFRRGTGVTASL